MSKAFDIGIESLAATASPSLPSVPPVPDYHPERVVRDSLSSSTTSGKRFYIETFGCQMNVHDSEKVAGALLERGYRAAENLAQADLVLYNTCSIREKAARFATHRRGR
jgi:hypothetical protein